jgi:uncharacterized membrane protein
MSRVSVLADWKKELKALGIGFILLTIVIFAAFRQSSVVEVLRTAFSLYWMFVLPGYALALFSKQGFVERLIIGITVQVAAYGLASYYAGLLGWHVATHGLILPIPSIIVGIVLWKKCSQR